MMEFKMIMKDFKEMTTRITKAVPKKASIAILQKVLVMTENNYVYFIATDTEQELRVYKNVTVVENGKFCIDLDVLKKVSKLKANLITIKYDTEEQKMIVNTGKKTVTFYDNSDPENFSLMDYENAESFYSSTYDDFTDMMERLSLYNARKDNTNPLMNAYSFNAEKNRVIALDGHRIAYRTVQNGFNPDSSIKEINIDRLFYEKLKPCLKEGKKDLHAIFINTCKSENGKCDKIVIGGNEFYMIVRISETKYWDIDRMILKESDTNISTFNRNELLEISKYNVGLMTDNKEPMVIYFDENDTYSYMNNGKEESFDEFSMMENKAVKSGFMIGFNPSYPVDMCNSIDMDDLKLGFINAKSPMMVYGNEYTILLLPVMINNGESTVKESINKLSNNSLAKTA